MSTRASSRSPLNGGEEDRVSRLLHETPTILRKACVIRSNFSHPLLYCGRSDGGVMSRITTAPTGRLRYMIYFVDSLPLLASLIEARINTFATQGGVRTSAPI